MSLRVEKEQESQGDDPYCGWKRTTFSINPLLNYRFKCFGPDFQITADFPSSFFSLPYCTASLCYVTGVRFLLKPQ